MTYEFKPTEDSRKHGINKIIVEYSRANNDENVKEWPRPIWDDEKGSLLINDPEHHINKEGYVTVLINGKKVAHKVVG